MNGTSIVPLINQLCAYYVSQLEKVPDLACRIQIIVPAMRVAVILSIIVINFKKSKRLIKLCQVAW
jgi:hypothetical protein